MWFKICVFSTGIHRNQQTCKILSNAGKLADMCNHGGKLEFKRSCI